MAPSMRFFLCSRMTGPLMQLPSQADISIKTCSEASSRSSSSTARMLSMPSTAMRVQSMSLSSVLKMPPVVG